jgi:hypothetical protein
MDRCDDILPFIADNRLESNCDPDPAKFVSEKERIGIGPAPDQQFSADRNDFCFKRVNCAYLSHSQKRNSGFTG